MLNLTVQEIRDRLKTADEATFASLKRNLSGDDRRGVISALAHVEKRLEEERAEADRLRSLYDFDASIARERGASVVLGLDEVGRGCLAGPVAVGGVVLAHDAPILRLNDSKQIKPEIREEIHDEIAEMAIACTVEYASASQIDAIGIVNALKKAFGNAIASIEGTGISVDVVLLDGNPLHVDAREVSVVKGDATSACIAAASIYAKVERDRLMDQLDLEYPGYDFSTNKGYGTKQHAELINKHGLSDIHRISFCGAFTQASLF